MNDENLEVCATCDSFTWFIGSAGFCQIKNSDKCCCDSMVDCMEHCDSYTPKEGK